MALQTNLTTSAAISSTMQTYYDKQLLINAKPNLVHQSFGQKVVLPKNAGKSITFRKWTPFPALTTPLIEIAGVGQTAQAMWYTPGYICGHGGPMDPDDAPLDGQWMYERYAIDFIKEDGEWKIWHFFVGTDLGCTAGEPYAERKPQPRPENAEPDPMMEIMAALPKPTIAMELYHCKYGWHNEPHFPRPYATHTAELSYGPEKYM